MTDSVAYWNAVTGEIRARDERIHEMDDKREIADLRQRLAAAEAERDGLVALIADMPHMQMGLITQERWNLFQAWRRRLVAAVEALRAERKERE